MHSMYMHPGLQMCGRRGVYLRQPPARWPEGQQGVSHARHDTRPGAAAGLLNIKFLNAVVKGIHDIEVAPTVKGQSMRGVELPWFGARRSKSAQVNPLVRELLDATTHGTYPDPLMPVDTDADRPLERGCTIFETGEDAAKTARFVVVVSPGEQELTLRRELLDAAHRTFGGVNVSLAVESQELWPTHPRADRDNASELPLFGPVFPPLEQQIPLGIEHLHTAVGLVGNIQPAVPADREPARAVEFPITASSPAPLPQELASRGIDRNLVRRPLFPLLLCKVREVNLSRTADRNASRSRQYGDYGQEFAVRGELLNTVVIEVGDEDLVGAVNGNADWKVKLSRFRTFTSPLPEESRLADSRRSIRLGVTPSRAGQIRENCRQQDGDRPVPTFRRCARGSRNVGSDGFHAVSLLPVDGIMNPS